MLESDYCPYCDAELEPGDVVEVCDVTGNKQVECPNCGKHIRANFEPRLCMSLVSEEDYLRRLEREKESYEKRLKLEDDQEGKDYYEMMIRETERKIEKAKANIEENEEIGDEY